MLASMLMTVLAAEGGGPTYQASGWLLDNVWLIPLLPALSFLAILFFGKRMPKGGSELGIAMVGIAFVLSVLTAGQWIGQVNYADTHTTDEVGCGFDSHSKDDGYGDDGHSGEENSLAEVLYPGAESAAAFAEEDKGGSTACPAINTTTWWSNGGQDFTVGTMVDGLTATLLVVVTLVSLLVNIYSTDYVAGDRRYTHFFAFLSLFTAAMLFFVVSENILQMIVGWELVGVCSFTLIGHWWEEQENSDAALKAFLTNRVGDMGLLVGMIILFFAAGQTWSVFEINSLANSGAISHNLLLIASLCLMAAVMSKSGQFFLHTWLPDAMAGPTPVSALIHAATMVVAGIYMIARLYGVFFNGLTIAGSSINALALVGAITCLGGAMLAFVQDDIKKVLAYSTISQLGYMALALGVGAWTAAVFHLMTHAFFKACLFLGAGSVAHSVHSFDMKKDMGGMRKFMPHTYRTFLIGSLALMGLPPLAGFWSKDEILVGTGGWGLFGGSGGNGAYTFALVMGIMAAMMTAAYMTRVIYLTFFGEFRGGHHDDDHAHAHGDEHDAHDHADEHAPLVGAMAASGDHGAQGYEERYAAGSDSHDSHADGHHDSHSPEANDHHHGDPHESGPRIIIPLYILAFLAIVSGFANFPPGFLSGSKKSPAGWQERFGHYVEPGPSAGYFPSIEHATPSWSLAIVATALVLTGAALSYVYYFKRVNRQSPMATELVNGPTSRNGLLKGGHTILKNKYYLDHIYDSGEPASSGMAGFMSFVFAAGSGVALFLSLFNGLDMNVGWSMVWAGLLALTVGTIVSRALITGVGIASFTKGALAQAAYWINQNVLDGVVNTVGTSSVKTAEFVYDKIDQGVVDGAVNVAGRASTGAGGELSRLQTGKVQQYATIMFAGATVLAGLLIVFI